MENYHHNLLFGIGMPVYACLFIVHIVTYIYGWYKTYSRKPLNPTIMYGILKVTFRGSVRMEQTSGPAGVRKQYFSFGYPIESKHLYILAPTAIAIWGAVFITFWTVFFVDVTLSKNGNKIGCYPLSPDLSNCCIKTGTVIEQYTHQCYQFAFNYAQGFGAAGGFLMVTTILIEGQLTILLHLRKKISANSKTRCIWIFLFSLFMLLPFLVILIIIALSVSFCLLKILFFKNWASIMLFIAYSYVLFISGIFSLQLVVLIKLKDPTRPNRNRRNSEMSDQNPSTNTSLDTHVHVDVHNEHDTVSGREFTTSWLAHPTPTVTEDINHDY